MKAINNLDKRKCVGCSACTFACPVDALKLEMSKGFYRIKLDHNKCIGCNACVKVCPVNKEKNVVDNSQQQFFAARNLTDEERMESTSGGIFSLFARKIIEQHGFVSGAVYDDDFHCHHIIASELADVKKMRTAKYTQSKLGQTFFHIRKLLEAGKLVLFSGTPCQISGLLNYLGKDYSNLYTVDVVCNSIPSPEAWKKYIRFRTQIIDKRKTYPRSINMRSKKTGWSHYNYSTEFQYPDGYNSYIPMREDPYIRAFTKGVISNDVCGNCIYRKNKKSDITLGDCWGIWDTEKEMDDNQGTSLIIINTAKGNKLWQSLSDKYDYIKIEPNSIMKYNEGLNARRKKLSHSATIIKQFPHSAILLIMYFQILVKRWRLWKSRKQL